MTRQNNSNSPGSGSAATATWRHYRVVRRVSAGVVRACGAVPVLIGILALSGWVLDLPLLRSGLPGAVQMKANTALAIVLAGHALLLFARPDGRQESRALCRLAQLLGLVVAAIGLGTAAEYLWSVDLRIDQALLRDTVPLVRNPGRMSPYSAAALALLGASLAILPMRRIRTLARGCAGVAAMIGLAMFTVHAWGKVTLRTDDWAPPIAFTTASCFILLGVGTWTATHRFAPGHRSLRVLLDAMELKIQASFVAAVVALTTVGGLVYGATAEYSREIERLQQVRQVRADLTGINATVAAAVFAQRTLVLSDDAQDDHAWRARATELARERRALADYPGLGPPVRQAAEALDRATAGLARVLQHAVDIREREGAAAARAFAGSGREAAALQELHGAIVRMDALARAEEEGSARLLRSSRERTVAVTVLALITVALVLGGVFVAIRREIATRTRTERTLRRRSTEATAAHRFLESVVQNIPHMIFVKDAKDLRFVRINRAGEQLTGLSQARLVGKSDHDFFPPVEADFFVAKDREVLARREIVDIPEEEILTQHHGVRLLHTKKIPLLDESGRPTYLVGISEDVTEARATERQIEMLHEALDQRAAELERVSRARSFFLATMSHEIRTPMNGMLGTMELLGLTRLDEKQREMLSVVSESGQALLRIIDDILDFSKIEAGKVELRDEVGSPAHIVRDLQNIHSPVAHGKGLRITTVLDPRLAPAIRIDTLRLRQILNNFVSNAVKFTAQGQVEIRVDVLAEEGGAQSLRFSVSDTGIGVSAEQQARLFEPFVQVATGTAVAGGTGLGLAISRRLAQLMGGTIYMFSALGSGTTLVLELRVPTAPVDLLPQPIERRLETLREMTAHLRAAPAAAHAEEDGRLVLVVDDHPVNRLLLQRQLESLGYTAETAADGDEALAKWSSGRFALVLTDCQMPRLSGYELAVQIREREQSAGVPRTRVIACTAMALEGEREKCLAAGMDDVVFKPVDLRQLLDALQRSGLTPGQHAAPPGRASLDTAFLAGTWGPDAKIIQAIVQAYLSSVREDCAALEQAIARCDLAAVRELAHRMLGASGMVGANGVAEACMLVTAASREGRWDDVRAAAQALEAEYARIEAEFGQAQ